MKTKVIKQFYDNGTLWREYEVLEDKPEIWHGFYKINWEDGKTISYETAYKNGKEHGECKWYDKDGSYKYSEWYFEGKKIGDNQEGKKEFEKCFIKDSWFETYFEVVSKITLMRELETPPKLIECIENTEGTGGFYGLAKSWATEFEIKYYDMDLEGEFFNLLEEFINEKLKNHE